MGQCIAFRVITREYLVVLTRILQASLQPRVCQGLVSGGPGGWVQDVGCVGLRRVTINGDETINAKALWGFPRVPHCCMARKWECRGRSDPRTLVVSQISAPRHQPSGPHLASFASVSSKQRHCAHLQSKLRLKPLRFAARCACGACGACRAPQAIIRTRHAFDRARLRADSSANPCARVEARCPLHSAGKGLPRPHAGLDVG